jgi:FkbM family methyltransferase
VSGDAAAVPGRFKRNVAANLAGRFWAAAAMIVFSPIYLRLLGVEAFGLVGIFLALLAVRAVLDNALSTPLNRELARLSAGDAPASELADVVRTLGVVFWVASLAIGVAVAAAAPWIVERWITLDALAPAEAVRAFRLMGATIALQMPMSFYAGGLMGLQRQVALNAFDVAAVTVQHLGAVAVLVWGSASIEAFFLWHVAFRLVQTTALGSLLWRIIGVAPWRARLRRRVLARLGRFSGDMFAISILGLAQSQLDNLVLSRMLPLAEFGYYSLARMVGTGLVALTGPVFTASFPRFTEAVTRRDPALPELYHRAAQGMAAAVVPAAVVLCLFAREVVLVWTGDAPLAVRIEPIVAVFVAGSALNGLLHVPYAMQLAHAWTRLALGFNALTLAVMVPAAIGLTRAYGAIGGATAWLLVNVVILAGAQPLMHRVLLRGELGRWYLLDTLRPVAVAVGLGVVLRAVLPAPADRFAAAGVVLVAAVALQVTVVLVLPAPRALVRSALRRGPAGVARSLFRACVPERWRSRWQLALLVRREWKAGEPELRLVPELVTPERSALDIGANRGVYARVMRDRARDVHAFEPNPRLARRMRHCFGDSVRVWNVALSDASGRAEMRIPVSGGTDIDGLSTLEPGAADDAEAVRTVEVEKRSLDSLGLRDIGFAKIDVEGHELAVLRGARATLERDRPALLVEMEDRHRPGAVDQGRRFLEELGYRGYFLRAGRLRPMDELASTPASDPAPADGATVRNFLFLPGPDADAEAARLSGALSRSA